MNVRRTLVVLASLAVALVGLPTGHATLGRRSRCRATGADQPRPPRLAGRHCRPARRRGGPHDVPARRGARDRRPVDLRRAQERRADPGRRRDVRPRDRHLRPGRLQRRRRLARRGRLHPALGRDRLAEQPRRGVPDAARPDLPPDGERRERRQRRAVDAARRHAQPQRGTGGAARPVRQRRVLLGRPHHLGARRGLRGVRCHAATPPTRRSPSSSASGWSSPSTPSTGRCSTPTARWCRSTAGPHPRGSSPTGPTPAPRPCSASPPTSRQVAATQHARR